VITVVTPTVHGREGLLTECRTSVAALGLPHLVGLDEFGEGPAVVRNRLVDQVTTGWVLFLDDDDLLLPNYLDAVEPHLSGADVVYTDWELTGAADPKPFPAFRADLLPQMNFIPVTACVRVGAFRTVGGFPDAQLEDHELWKALLAVGYRFRHVPVVAWHYRRQAKSRTSGSLT
jgi:hypothetical protein